MGSTPSPTSLTPSTKQASLQVLYPHKPQQRRSVTFDERVLVRKIINVGDYSHHEIIATWYSQQEFSDIENAMAVIAQKINGGLYDECKDDIWRRDGDLYIEDDRCRRGIEISVHIESILMEQALQLEGGFFDPEHIAEVSEHLSAESVSVAREAARLAEIQALRC
jgi:hypothetical protein